MTSYRCRMSKSQTFINLPSIYLIIRLVQADPMNNRIVALLVIVALAAAGIAAISFSGKPSGPPLPLTIGGPALETSALIYIAEDQHYFEQNGLAVTEWTYDSGGATAGGLLKGDVDIGMMSEFVMANTILNGGNITSLGYTDRFENMFLIGRKDRGTDTVQGLNGKTVGIPKGTIAEFYFGRYLDLHRVNPGNVSVVDVRPATSLNGSVDAMVTWHPYLDAITAQPAGNLTVWPIQGGQLTYWNAVSRADWATAHPAEISRFLRSLAEAEQFSMQHPVEANLIVQKRLGYSDAYMAAIAPNNQYSLSLDRGMMAAMEDEARWSIERNMTSAKQIPNFARYMDVNGLEAIKPGSIDLG